GGVLRPARLAHRPAQTAPFRPEDGAALLRTADRRPEEVRRQTDYGVRHRPGLSHRLLGAALRRRVRKRGGGEAADGPPRPPAASADDRAERDHQFPLADDAGAVLGEHHRPGAVPRRGPHHRRGRRGAGAGHAVAGAVAADDAAARADVVDPVELHADAAGAAVLPARAGRTAGGRLPLKKELTTESQRTQRRTRTPLPSLWPL